jgi:hypothetical protein
MGAIVDVSNMRRNDRDHFQLRINDPLPPFRIVLARPFHHASPTLRECVQMLSNWHS